MMKFSLLLCLALVSVVAADYLIAPTPVPDNRYIYNQITDGQLTETCYIINFDESPAGPISDGDFISEQYADWGVHFTYIAEDLIGNPTSTGLRALDTTNPSHVHDNDLLTPNRGFVVDGVQGIGVGTGGAPGQIGENSRPLGNVMILQSKQDTNAPSPDDSTKGGTMVFNFDRPVRVHQVGILDIDDETGGNAKAYNAAGDLLASFTYHRYGNNAFENLNVDVRDVRRFEMFFTGSGATSSLLFCESDDEPPIPFLTCNNGTSWDQTCPQNTEPFPNWGDIVCDSQVLCEERCCSTRTCEDVVGQCPGLEQIPSSLLNTGCGTDEQCLDMCCQPLTCEDYVHLDGSFCPQTGNPSATCSSHSECIEQCCQTDCDCPVGFSEYCKKKRVYSPGRTVCVGECDILTEPCLE